MLLGWHISSSSQVNTFPKLSLKFKDLVCQNRNCEGGEHIFKYQETSNSNLSLLPSTLLSFPVSSLFHVHKAHLTDTEQTQSYLSCMLLFPQVTYQTRFTQHGLIIIPIVCTSGELIISSPWGKRIYTSTHAHMYIGIHSQRHTDTQAHMHADINAHRHTRTHSHRQTYT